MQVLNSLHRNLSNFVLTRELQSLFSPKALGGDQFCRKDLEISEEACSVHVGAC
jgi:hypothetical protein